MIIKINIINRLTKIICSFHDITDLLFIVFIYMYHYIFNHTPFYISKLLSLDISDTAVCFVLHFGHSVRKKHCSQLIYGHLILICLYKLNGLSCSRVQLLICSDILKNIFCWQKGHIIKQKCFLQFSFGQIISLSSLVLSDTAVDEQYGHIVLLFVD